MLTLNTPKLVPSADMKPNVESRVELGVVKPSPVGIVASTAFMAGGLMLRRGCQSFGLTWLPSGSAAGCELLTGCECQ